ncbi:hypothetical protein Tco_0749630 [Tanacetum coccineum]|uniref:Uncharacterized protein n=1 Tax=Tanacetum coccineum TaxID=301880 RepID=A0ABQ4YYY6_9ASTR
MEQMTTLCDLVDQAIQKKEEEERIAEDQAAKDRYWKIPICYDDDEDDTIAITPVLPIKEPDNSLSMGDEHLGTTLATESDEFIKSSVEDLVPIPSESEGIPDKMCDVPLCENTTPLNAPKSIHLRDNSYSIFRSCDPVYLYISLNLFLEEITPLIISLFPESENFRFNLEEISSGCPTTHSDLSLSELLNFPTSDFNHEEFADELAHIMSLPNLECFKFKIEPDLGELTSIDLGIRKDVSTSNVNVPLEDDQSSLFTYVVWIFLAFLTYPVVPPYLLSTRNEDTIFDPGISMYHSFMPDVSHRSGTFMKFNDCPDCEGSRVLSFVYSITRASNPQLHFGNPDILI